MFEKGSNVFASGSKIPSWDIFTGNRYLVLFIFYFWKKALCINFLLKIWKRKFDHFHDAEKSPILNRIIYAKTKLYKCYGRINTIRPTNSFPSKNYKIIHKGLRLQTLLFIGDLILVTPKNRYIISLLVLFLWKLWTTLWSILPVILDSRVGIFPVTTGVI